MPKFVDMPHRFSFDIEELLYYRVSYGDTWMEEKENGPLLPTEHDERDVASPSTNETSLTFQKWDRVRNP